jgi:hypothetical protein
MTATTLDLTVDGDELLELDTAPGPDVELDLDVDGPTADDWGEYAAYLDTLNEVTDPEEADRDEAARVEAFLERHGLDSAPF